MLRILDRERVGMLIVRLHILVYLDLNGSLLIQLFNVQVNNRAFQKPAFWSFFTAEADALLSLFILRDLCSTQPRRENVL